MVIFEVLVAVALNFMFMLLSISVIPDLLTNESLLGGLWLFLTAMCLCIHVLIYHRLDAHSRLCFASIQTQTHHVNAPCAKQIGALCTRKACLGLVILKLKACLFVQPQFQECGRECECVARREEEHWAQVLWFSQPGNHIGSFIYSPQSGDIQQER